MNLGHIGRLKRLIRSVGLFRDAELAEIGGLSHICLRGTPGRCGHTGAEVLLLCYDVRPATEQHGQCTLTERGGVRPQCRTYPRSRAGRRYQMALTECDPPPH